MNEEVLKLVFEELKNSGVKLIDYSKKVDTFISDPLERAKDLSLTMNAIPPLLDFSEHDKPFEDEIKLLKERIEKMESEKKFLRMRCMDDAIDAFDRGSYGALTIVGRRGALEAENKLLKQRIADLESGLNEMEKIKSHWIDRAVEWQQKCENLESEKSENCEKETISDVARPSAEWYENRYQQDCITINRLNTTIDVLIHKVEYLRQFAGLE